MNTKSFNQKVKNIHNQLPKDWNIKKLGELCDIQTGKYDANHAKSKGKYRFYTCAYEFMYCDTKRFSGESLILPGNGANVGEVFYYNGEFDAYQRTYVLNEIKTFPKYLYYHLLCNWKKRNQNKQFGSATNYIRMGNFTDYELPIPPKSTQQAIVSKIEELFSELDKGIEQLKIAQQQLKTYRQSVLKWAFEGKLTNENVKEGELPKEWKEVVLKDVCKIIGGVTKGRDFKGKETIHLPYLRVANVQDGYLDLEEIKTIEVLPSDKEKYKLLFGDILYTEGGDKDKLGRGAIWKNEIDDCIHQNHIFRARPLSKEIDSKYIAYFSQTRIAKNYFFKHGKQTTNLASINLTILSNLPVPICSFKEQNNIVQEIESRLSVADKMDESITQSLQQTEALRQSILKKAFEGKLV